MTSPVTPENLAAQIAAQITGDTVNGGTLLAVQDGATVQVHTNSGGAYDINYEVTVH